MCLGRTFWEPWDVQVALMSGTYCVTIRNDDLDRVSRRSDMFVTGSPVMTKWPVVPESPITIPFGMGILLAALFANWWLASELSLESTVAWSMAWLLLDVLDVTTVASSSSSSSYTVVSNKC